MVHDPSKMIESVSKIMQHFNFNKVLDHMEQVNWQWHCKEGMRIPTIDELEATARDLLVKAAMTEEETYSIATGGFLALKHTLGMQLVFYVTDWHESHG